jgi:peptidoglycan/LPS O-acetylase OafA/YrhL
MGEVWQLGTRPALTGVRGIAILLVMMCHTAVPHLFGGGPVGVTAFFTLSGFLITGLLLGEHDRTGRIDLPKFYVRRARRLLPALVCVIAALSLASLFAGPWFLELNDIPPALFYYANWVEAFPPHTLHVLGGTWSLAIEEQFYLVWPLLVIAVAPRGRRAVMVIAGIGIALSLATRIALWRSGADVLRIYYGSDTTAAGLLGGAFLVAWLGAGRTAPIRPAWAAAGCAALIGVSLIPDSDPLWLAGPPLAAVCTAVVLWAVGRGTPAAPVPGWLTGPVLIWFGERSYALYLWHMGLAWVLLTRVGVSWPVNVVITFSLSALAAELSYRLVEDPIRHRRWPVVGTDWRLRRATRSSSPTT